VHHSGFRVFFSDLPEFFKICSKREEGRVCLLPLLLRLLTRTFTPAMMFKCTQLTFRPENKGGRGAKAPWQQSCPPKVFSIVLFFNCIYVCHPNASSPSPSGMFSIVAALHTLEKKREIETESFTFTRTRAWNLYLEASNLFFAFKQEDCDATY